MIRQSVPTDVTDLAPRMRDADKREAEALAGVGPLEALSMGLFHSDVCMTAIGKDGSVVGMFGVGPHPTHALTGYVWLLTSEEIADNGRELLTEGRKWLDEQHALYPVLTNWVTESNDVHITLIKHLGFTFHEPRDNIGPGKVRAIQFERIR